MPGRALQPIPLRVVGSICRAPPGGPRTVLRIAAEREHVAFGAAQEGRGCRGATEPTSAFGRQRKIGNTRPKWRLRNKARGSCLFQGPPCAEMARSTRRQPLRATRQVCRVDKLTPHEFFQLFKKKKTLVQTEGICKTCIMRNAVLRFFQLSARFAK